MLADLIMPLVAILAILFAAASVGAAIRENRMGPIRHFRRALSEALAHHDDLFTDADHDAGEEGESNVDTEARKFTDNKHDS